MRTIRLRRPHLSTVAPDVGGRRAIQRGGVVTVRAFVLIETQVGNAGNVAKEIRAIPGVVTADDVTGPYDVIAQTEAESVDDLGRMVIGRLQLVDGIRKTLTCPILVLE
jgi:DNA-binding Lrp family transcriptional regulator